MLQQPRPKLIRVWAFAATLALVFACGVALGQETALHKLRKYLVPSESTELDRRFLAIQIEDIQNALNALEESGAPERTGVPTFNLNPKTGKIQVLVAVHGPWVDGAPLAQVEKSLKAQATEMLLLMKFHLPEISDQDIVINFTKINMETGEIDNKFAEYKNGQLTLRR